MKFEYENISIIDEMIVEKYDGILMSKTQKQNKTRNMTFTLQP